MRRTLRRDARWVAASHEATTLVIDVVVPARPRVPFQHGIRDALIGLSLTSVASTRR